MTRVSSAMAGLLVTTSLVVAIACDSSTDARRSPLSPSPAAETSQPLRVFGVVVDADRAPIAGARVSVQAGGEPPALDTMSDVQGAYSLEVERAVFHVISAAHDGFEPNELLLTPFGREMRFDVRLQRIVRIKAGESVTLTVVPADPACSDGDQVWTCRRVRVVAPIGGALQFAVPTGTSAPRFLLRVADNWDITPGPSIAVPVSAGSETIVELLLVGQAPQTVRFSSGLGP
jgi:hypothetical protein